MTGNQLDLLLNLTFAAEGERASHPADRGPLGAYLSPPTPSEIQATSLLSYLNSLPAGELREMIDG